MRKVLLIRVWHLIDLSLQLLIFLVILTLTMLVILTVDVLFLVIFSLYVRVLFLGTHPSNVLQFYPLLKPSMRLQLKVSKKLLGCEVLLLSLVLHKTQQCVF